MAPEVATRAKDLLRRSVLLACMKGKPHSRLHGGCKLCHEGSVQYPGFLHRAVMEQGGSASPSNI